MGLSFSEGDIIYLQRVPYTDHPKYQLTLSIIQNLFFVINSDISNAQAINDDIKNCQVKLEKNPNHTFMDKDISYIACHQFAPSKSCSEIERDIQNSVAEVKGKIDKKTLDEIKDVVLNKAKTLAPFDKLEIIRGLDKISYP